MDGGALTDTAGIQRAKCCTSRGCKPGYYHGGRRTLFTSVAATLVVFGLLHPTLTQGMRPRLRFMTNHCTKTLDVYGDVLLALTPSQQLYKVRDVDRNQNVHCRVVLRAPEDSKIFLHFLQLGISADLDHHDRVKVYDNVPTQTQLTPPAGLYGQLNRDLAVQDAAGSRVKDYKSSRNEIVVEYLGIPTHQNPGFRILVTVFKSPDSNGVCPMEHFKCPTESLVCVPASTTCDGYANCGMADPGDERNCDSFDTVTSLMDHYSLAFDIVVAIFLPVSVFISVTVIALCLMRRYIRLKITIETEPPVEYSSAKGGQARVKIRDDKTRPPPSYDDVVMSYSSEFAMKPPAYSTLVDGVKRGEIEVAESEDDLCRFSPRARRQLRRHRQRRADGEAYHDSLSSLDEGIADSHMRKSQEYLQSPNTYKNQSEHKRQRAKRQAASASSSACLSDTDEEDDRRRRNKRKHKKYVCVKRRADDLVCDTQTAMNSNSQEPCTYLEVEMNQCGNKVPTNDHHHNHHHHTSPMKGHRSSPRTVHGTDNRASPIPSNRASPTYSASSPRSSRVPTTHDPTQTMPLCTPSLCIPPPPSNVDINKESPTEYHLRDTDPSPPYTPGRAHKNKPSHKLHHTRRGVTSEKGEDIRKGLKSHAGNDHQKPSQYSAVPCVVEMNLDHSSSTSPSKSNSPPAITSNTSSPSPSSCSTNDQDQAIHSETESKPPSHADSRTESNGSLADQFLNPHVKQSQGRESAAEDSLCYSNHLTSL